MRQRYQPLAVVAAFAIVVAGVEVALQGHDRDEPLVITQLVLEGSRDVDRHLVEETYRGRLAHTGRTGATDVARVTATLAQPFWLPVPGFVQVIDGDLAFGTIRAGETVESADTITIRRLRHQPLGAHQLRWTIQSRPDLLPSDAWAGHWRFTLTTKRAGSGAVVAVTEIADDVGTGMPFGFALLPPFARCQWRGTADALDATCDVRARLGGCLVEGSAAVTLDRADDVATGQVSWHVDNSGDCGDSGGSGGQTIEIAGTRSSRDSEPDRFAPGWLASFSVDPAFSVLATAGLRER